MDDNNSGTLDMYEFKKGIRDFAVDVDPQDAENLFKAFDLNGNGEIDFDEFIRVVVGPMNLFRTQLVQKAYRKIDFNGDGVLDIRDIKGKYDASKHPDVKSGKKTEDEVLKEFLETFEMHHNVMHGTKSDGIVTLDEFIEYYTNISANIDNDAYFDLMMNNAWNLDDRNNTNNMAYAGSQAKITQVSARDAWRNDHHRNLFGTDKATPFAKTKGSEW
jgi:Ca2+-binding EF-hand superfamily protein